MKDFELLLEKVFWTYVQALVALWLGLGDALGSNGFSQDLAIAALPAALTVLANGLPGVPENLSFALDLLWRVARTFAVAFIGMLVGQPVFGLDPGALNAAYTAGVMAVLAVIKGAAAKKVGDPESAALLPAA